MNNIAVNKLAKIILEKNNNINDIELVLTNIMNHDKKLAVEVKKEILCYFFGTENA